MNVQSLERIKNSTIMFSFSNYYTNTINVQLLEQITFPLLPWEYVFNNSFTHYITYFLNLQEHFNLPTSKSSIFVFKLFKPVGPLTNSLMSSLSTSALKPTKSFLATKSDVSASVACPNSF